MTERELLEAAAKAVGYEKATYEDMSGWGEVRYGFAFAMWVPEIADYWNPMMDSGQALELAIALRITILHEDENLGGRHIRTIEAIGPERMDGSRHCEMHSLNDEGDKDPMAIVRECIVRAAAASAPRAARKDGAA